MRVVLAACGAVVGVITTGWLFDKMSWPVFHSWGLAHGSAFILWPLYFVVLYLLLGLKSDDQRQASR